ncbi:hypothetical protein Zmor_008662 [Zophobas morio]|jgi:hypothetical protein|uniref:Uncharacterized protein n=1 Tax=Zophobas morio TaxID=2755281 RepID=A0AA38M0S8_9CUCU|nr:hypothetical protein Zmor_008662 [Zophobas morio]
MAFGKKKVGKNLEKSQYEKETEERGPNVSSYEDDPLLNMEPVFTDDFAGQKENQFIQQTHSNVVEGGASPLAAIIEKHRAENPRPEAPKIAGPLGDIIGNARKKSDEIAHDVEERDPVIAKLKKIDQLLRSGGTDSSLYTDVKKSQVGYYAQRAKEFISENVTKKPESDAERIARMAQETRERGTNNYVPNHEDKTSSIRDLVFASRNKEKNDVNVTDNDFRRRAEEMARLAAETANKKKMTFNSISNNSVFSIAAQDKFNFEKRMEKQQDRLNIAEIAEKYESDKIMTPQQIEELETKIKNKIEKIQKHKAALAKKEEKVMKLILQTDSNSSNASNAKIAQLLEQRTVELEAEAKRLDDHESELEKTIADLKKIVKEKAGGAKDGK